MNLIEAVVDRVKTLSKDAPAHLVTSFDPAQLPSERRIKSTCVAAGAENAIGVAEVLFPNVVIEATGTVEDRLAAGLKKIRKLRAAARQRLSGWSDTYFERLVGQHVERTGAVTRIGPNRVAEIIRKANDWEDDFRAAFYASTTREKDQLRKRGAPCLQYVQFELFDDDRMRLFALYRSHDFVNKALGNFIGLRRLGTFVANETSRTLVDVTVVSLNPFVGGKAKAKAFCDGLAKL